MRHTIWTLILVMTVGVFAFAAGKNAHTPMGPQVLAAFQTEQPPVVLVKTGARQQKKTLQENEGCQVIPNGDLSQQKTNERDNSMKGLIF